MALIINMLVHGIIILSKRSNYWIANNVTFWTYLATLSIGLWRDPSPWSSNAVLLPPLYEPALHVHVFVSSYAILHESKCVSDKHLWLLCGFFFLTIRAACVPCREEAQQRFLPPDCPGAGSPGDHQTVAHQTRSRRRGRRQARDALGRYCNTHYFLAK